MQGFLVIQRQLPERCTVVPDSTHLSLLIGFKPSFRGFLFAPGFEPWDVKHTGSEGA
jgi:hypothetical protein